MSAKRTASQQHHNYYYRAPFLWLSQISWSLLRHPSPHSDPWIPPTHYGANASISKTSFIALFKDWSEARFIFSSRGCALRREGKSERFEADATRRNHGRIVNSSHCTARSLTRPLTPCDFEYPFISAKRATSLSRPNIICWDNKKDFHRNTDNDSKCFKLCDSIFLPFTHEVRNILAR